MAKTPKTMVELFDEIADEEEEEIPEEEASEKSSNLSAQEISHEVDKTTTEDVKETKEETDSKDEYEEETFEYESNFEVEIRSTPPSNLPDGVHLFNVSLLQSTLDDISFPPFPPMQRKPFKNGTRQSLTFTNDQMWEIERQNRHLMERIFRPSGSSRCSLRQSEFQANSRTSSAAINRKKRERQIELDNQVLYRKLQAIKSRRPK